MTLKALQIAKAKFNQRTVPLRFVFLFLYLVTSSCVREVKNAVLPSQEPVLVISCFISPQQYYLAAQVYLSKPLYSLSDPTVSDKISNALVTISDGNTSLVLNYARDLIDNDSSYIYKFTLASPFFITPGQTYTLDVSTPDGKHASASTTVPTYSNQTAVPIVDTLPSENGHRNFKIDVQWKDSAGIQDFYRVQYQIYDIDLGPYRPQLTKSFHVVSDAGEDGSTLFVRNGNQIRSVENIATKTIKLSMSVIDQNYYKYYNSLQSYSDDNPFAEPTLIYSNVNGGLGIFGSYMEYIKAYDF